MTSANALNCGSCGGLILSCFFRSAICRSTSPPPACGAGAPLPPPGPACANCSAAPSLAPAFADPTPSGISASAPAIPIAAALRAARLIASIMCPPFYDLVPEHTPSPIRASLCPTMITRNRMRSCAAACVNAAAPQKKLDRFVDPLAQCRRRQRRAKPERPPLWPGDDDQDELLGGKTRIDASHLACRDAAFELPRDALDSGRRAQFVQHMRQLRKPARLGDDHAVQCQRLRGQRHPQHVLGRLPQSVREVRAFEERRVEGRGLAR